MKEFLAQYMPVAASEHAAGIDALNAWVHWLMLILFVVFQRQITESIKTSGLK